MDIVLKNISKAYGDNRVLTDYSDCFEGGLRHALAAPSGRGKTTLLRLILGLEQPDSGEIIGVPAKKAVLFQEDRLMPGLSLIKNLEFALGKPDKTRVQALLTALGLWESRNIRAASLSGGMARRAALARALLSPGELLILDEPFNGLDGDNRLAAAKAILTYCAGKTVILVTHRPEDLALMEIQRVHTL